MQRGLRSLYACFGTIACSASALAADPHTPSTISPPVPARSYGYDIPGQVHDDPTLQIRSIVSSERRALPDRDGVPLNELTYRVCNIEGGDQVTKRAPAKLYFQWPAAGFRTSLQRELPFEWCAKLVREVTAPVKQGTTDILYTYNPTAIPALSIWTMSWDPPWTKPSHYWSYGLAVYEELAKGIKNPQQMFRIHTTRKSPEDKAAYQLLGWRQGTELYLALPKWSSEELDRYRASLGSLEGQGVRFSIRSAKEAVGDFDPQDASVVQGFEGRDVLKIDLAPNREKANQYQQFQLDVPVSNLELVGLSAVLREKNSKRAMYQATYIISGN